MKMAALASGSSSNCFYVEDDQGKAAVLIDAGISTRQICQRLGILGLTAGKIAAIFITHEHSDHIKGVDVFARKFKVPIYATEKTVKTRFLCADSSLIKIINNDDMINIGGMNIEAFSKPHTAADPVSYTIYGHKKVSIITDIGYPCKRTTQNIHEADFLFLEFNHDPEMLRNGPYPEYLKKWIAGDHGHLSNMQAASCVLEHASPQLKNIVLSHLSETNNDPQTAFDTFNSLIRKRGAFSPEVGISTRYHPTQLFTI